MNVKLMMDKVKAHHPLIHNITNYVTVNDCANILLACGASPIMADDKREVEEITSICHGLNINIGTLNERTIESMILAGKKAQSLGHPIVLDPVGTGASGLRTQTTQQLLKTLKISVIKGNVSEIKTIYHGTGTTHGVDVSDEDKLDKNNLTSTISMAKALSRQTGSVIVITGPIDIISDDQKTILIKNGHKAMSTITGTGCMLSALITAYIAANDSILEATATAVGLMGLAGEYAYDGTRGNSSYRNNLIDAVYTMTPDILQKGIDYEIN